MQGAKTNLTSWNWHRMRIAVAMSACLFVSTLLSVPAMAQSAAAPAQLVVLEPLSLVKVKDLDFGQIIVNGAGTVVLNPTGSGTCTASGNLVRSGTCKPAEFAGLGSTGRFVRVRRPASNSITLTGPGTNMTVTNLQLDASPDLQLWFQLGRGYYYRIVSPDGSFDFRVGGTLNVAAGQAPGVYTGTFDVDINYY
ncbi:MAG: DUF4402 domain-containing protein [Sphingomonadaceae bacterium]|nr:DUF4402 domain-containing protein [Sphingomonadaceae bacterium]